MNVKCRNIKFHMSFENPDHDDEAAANNHQRMFIHIKPCLSEIYNNLDFKLNLTLHHQLMKQNKGLFSENYTQICIDDRASLRELIRHKKSLPGKMKDNNCQNRFAKGNQPDKLNRF